MTSVAAAEQFKELAQRIARRKGWTPRRARRYLRRLQQLKWEAPRGSDGL